MQPVAFLFFLVAILIAPAWAAAAEKRVALVIGNARYKLTTPLDNPVNDARLVAKTLEAAGFDVTVLYDAGLADVKRGLQTFATKARAAGPDAVVAFYYAGHGVQVRGVNYLVPVDAEIDGEDGLELYAVRADAVMQLVANVGTRLNIVVLDACRNNPFRGFRSSSRGLAQIDAPAGTLVAFSTSPNSVARDGPKGGNSPYTAALARVIVEPGLRIEDVFKRVRQIVSAETNGAQVPWESSSLVGEFYPAGPPAGAPGAAAREWQDVKDSTSIAVLERYLARHGADPVYAGLARERIDDLKRRGARPERRSAPPSKAPATPPVPALDDHAVGQVFRDCADRDGDGEGICPEMTVIPPGDFLVGSPAGEVGRSDDEAPQRLVALPRPFAVGRHEVTFAEWDACVEAKACRHQPETRSGRGRQPVVRVSWEDVTTGYLPWLSRKTGRQYRLPSEAEWEYAARARTMTAFTTGAAIGRADAAFDGGAPGQLLSRAMPVGSFPPNAFGLHDVHGNVSEWVQDCYATSYAQMPETGAPVQHPRCAFRVARGGSWFSNAAGVRSARRYPVRPAVRDEHVGFRVARDLVTQAR